MLCTKELSIYKYCLWQMNHLRLKFCRIILMVAREITVPKIIDHMNMNYRALFMVENFIIEIQDILT